MIGIIFVMSSGGTANAQSVLQYGIPPVYYQWMVELASCEHLALPPVEDFQQMKFFLIVDTHFKTVMADGDTLDVLAVTNAPKHVIVSSSPFILDPYIMKHEFLHYVLFYNFPDGRYNNGKNDHPTEYFGKCEVKPD
jgi:hypothetical protein